MKVKLKYLFFLLLIPFLLDAQENQGLTFGGQKEEIGYDIIQCSDGGYLLGGSTKSFGTGNMDIYVIKLNENANAEWIKTIGWKHNDLIRSITEVDGGYIIVGDVWDYGYSLLDIIVIKLDYDGNIIWQNLYGTHSKDIGFDGIELEDKSIAILGYTRDIDPFGDILLIKTDKDGNEIWRNNFGTPYDDYGIEVITFDTDKFLIIGTKAGFYDDVYATYFNSHDADIMLICCDKNGNELWQKTYGGYGHDFGYSIVTEGESIYICGSTQSNGNGSFDMILLKTDNEGNELWSKTYGGSEYDYGISMVNNSEGGLYLSGTTKSFGQNLSPDYYLIKTDYEGNEIWNLTFGGDLIENVYKAFSTADSGVILIGKTNSFGNGYFDILLVKVDKNGIIENLISGIDSTFISDIQLYPNPVSDQGRFRNLSTTEIPELYIEIVSMSGRVISSFKVVAPDYSFNTNYLGSGFYIYRVRMKEDSKIIFTGKLIVN
ncbi:MAG: hypothetical protein C0598_09750 [Marinilabiliales bacterium]|nr:MAG: hypothetical protein C0598_09750 [Marinilabiliales bacterium]